jgi:hypothetical protein
MERERGREKQRETLEALEGSMSTSCRRLTHWPFTQEMLSQEAESVEACVGFRDRGRARQRQGESERVRRENR